MPYPVTERTRVRRRSGRASYDVALVHAILDAGLVCHLGLVEAGRPVMIPTAYVRVDESIVVHGSGRNRTLLALAGGAEACCTVTLLDGLVLARSAFHHSVNYRSVVLFARGEPVERPEEKAALLEAFTERLYPGRWGQVRSPTESELRGTLVVRLPLHEVSAKHRSGPPVDDEDDYGVPVWAGVATVAERVTGLVPDARLHPAVAGASIPAIVLHGGVAVGAETANGLKRS